MEEFLQQFNQESFPLSLALLLSLVAGVVSSAVCPCTLPAGIGAVGYFAGETEKKKHLKKSIAFFSGIVISVAVVGILSEWAGIILTEAFGRFWALAMAGFSFSFAVAFLLLNKINLSGFNISSGIAAFAFGSIFSLGTAAAPLLFLLSFFTGKTSALLGTGTFIALAFGIGRGFPFLLAGIFSGALAWMIRLRGWQKTLQRGASVSLVLAGIYFLSVYFRLS